MFKLSVITDEVSQKLETALEFAKKYHLSAVELRSVEGKDPFEYSKNDVINIKNQADAYGLKISGISAPFYKCDYYNKKEREAHLDGLKRCLEWAEILDTKIIRGFDFWYDKNNPVSLNQRAEQFVLPAELAKKSGKIIALEYDPSVNSMNCENVARLVSCINDPCVRTLYDPGNDMYSPRFEIPYPNGFSFIKDTFVHVHIKDAIYNDGDTIATPVGEGDVDYRGIFLALKEMNYDGYITLETHYKPNITIKESVLKQPKGDAISYMGVEASSICMENLLKIIKEAGCQL